MKHLAIDKLFIEIFEIDRDYDVCDCSYYLDIENGTVIVIDSEFEQDETIWNGDSWISVDSMKQVIEENGDRFIEITGLSHSDHHDILWKFIQSNWTDDEEYLQKAREAYFGSIGGWKKEIGYDEYILNNWEVFKEEEILRRALKFFHDHQIEPLGSL